MGDRQRGSGTRSAGTLEVHCEAGPPSKSMVVHRGQRVCELHVATDHDSGAIDHIDGRRLAVSRPPGSDQWWLLDDRDACRVVIARNRPVGERFEVTLDGVAFDVVPVGRWWRRRWRVCDREERTVLEVGQRLFTRPIHDLTIRSGDLPPDLCWVVAWLLAERTSRGLTQTRRPRWAGRVT